VLERAGLITRGRDAQRRPCRLETSPLREVTEWAEHFRRFWDASYARLDDYLETDAGERVVNPTTTPGTVFSTPSDREVAWTRSFAAPRERVFRALTEPEHVQRWMLGPDGWTMPVCEMDLRRR
jgi:Activator of Hsp90 ATPase homolog 1-like protein